MPAKLSKSVFAWKYWWYTCAAESLFDLSPTELRMYKDFVDLSLDHL